jgi:hypothetical protein
LNEISITETIHEIERWQTHLHKDIEFLAVSKHAKHVEIMDECAKYLYNYVSKFNKVSYAPAQDLVDLESQISGRNTKRSKCKSGEVIPLNRRERHDNI